MLLHSALSRAEVIFGSELRQYDAAGWLRLVELHTDTHGMLDVADLDTIVPDLAERTAYACGPAGLLDALEEHYAARDLTLTTERFRPATVVAGEGGTVTFADGTVVEADGATPILDAAESAGVLMPSGCRMGICMGCVVPMKEGAVRDLRNGALTVAVPGETGPGGVRIQTCINAAAGPCHHRPLIRRSRPPKGSPMTTITKKPVNPTAHLTPEDIEQLGVELDAIRQDILDSRGEKDAAYIRNIVTVQRRLELASPRGAPRLGAAAGVGRSAPSACRVAKILENMEIGHNVMHGQWDWMRDPKIHSTTWEWDNASTAEGWKHSHNEIHHTYTNIVGKDNDLGYGIMRVDEDQRWHPMYLAQPLWNFINACFFEYGIAAYDLELGKQPARSRRRSAARRSRRSAKKTLKKIRKQATKDYVVHPALSIPTGWLPADAGRELHRQPGAQRLVALGDHVRPLPRGRRDLREEVDPGQRDPRRVVPAPDARLGQHLRLQGHAPDDRQPVAPDRAPPLPRPAVQPVRRGRAEGAGALRQVRPQLPRGAAAAAGLLAPGTRSSGSRCPTAGWRPPTSRTCPSRPSCSGR